MTYIPELVTDKVKIFLGDINNFSWLNQFISTLKIDKSNIVFDFWSQSFNLNGGICLKQDCDVCLYAFTSKMIDVYSVAKAVDDSNKTPNNTIFVMEEGEFDSQWSSLTDVAYLIESNGSKVFKSLEDAAEYINLTYV
jgi:hypothetical protein